MKNLNSYSCWRTWSAALLLGALVAGCGGGGSDGPGITLAVASPVVSTTPADVATNVQTNGKILARFSTPMDPASFNKNTFMVTAPGAVPVDGTVTFEAASNTAIFTPAKPLAADTLFTATITTGARDTAGLALASNFVWTFTTGKAADIKPPVITQTDPLDSANGVATNRKITAVFDEAVDPASISATTFTLTGPGAAPVAGLVSLVGTTAIFTPVSNLNASTPYTATIKAGVKDLAGNKLASDLAWRFTTANAAQALAKGPSPLNLGTAGSYAILAKAGVSTTGTTHIDGDIGLSPAAETFITGFSQARDPSNQWSTALIVTGKLYAANMAVPTPAKLTTAVGDMETAYTDAAGRSLPDTTELGAGNISGLTLEPGLHKWGTGLLIGPTGVTLKGGANDVWIFQVAQDLTVANGAIVTLSGGAQAKNIFWQVAGKTTLGTTADVKGTILSKTLIALQTGAMLSGRALAQTAVTLQANTVTQPAP